MNTIDFKIFSLLSKEAIFLAVFMKNMADPLGVNVRTLNVHSNITLAF